MKCELGDTGTIGDSRLVQCDISPLVRSRVVDEELEHPRLWFERFHFSCIADATGSQESIFSKVRADVPKDHARLEEVHHKPRGLWFRVSVREDESSRAASWCEDFESTADS